MKKNQVINNRKRKGFIIFIIGFVLLVTLGLYEMYYNYMVSQVTEDTGETIEVYVQQGENLKSVAKDLKDRNLIKSEFAFLRYVKNNNLDTKIHAGQHYIPTGATVDEVTQLLLVSEDKQKTVKILEGWSNKDVLEYFAGQGLPQGSFEGCLEDCVFDNDFITEEIKEGNYEGFLFPDTYKVSLNPTPEEIIKKMLNNFEKKMSIVNSDNIDVSEELSQFIKSHNEDDFIKIASLLEREVRTDGDREIVSGIIWKRLQKNMGLGIDATVLYVLGDWNAELTYDEINIDSPYNTRKYQGLPPTPICQPSLKSIQAAYNPIETDYLYYLTADNGEMIYSKDLNEHNRNKRLYIK